MREAKGAIALAADGLRGAVAMGEVVPDGLAGGDGGGDVDDGVPEALQREHERGGVVEAEVEGGRVSEGVDAVDGRGDLFAISSSVWIGGGGESSEGSKEEGEHTQVTSNATKKKNAQRV